MFLLQYSIHILYHASSLQATCWALSFVITIVIHQEVKNVKTVHQNPSIHEPHCTYWLVHFRYVWSHGITPRKMDVIPTKNGDLTVQQRGERTSFTFRFIRKGECNCVYHDLCDSYKKKYKKSEVDTNCDAVAAKLESLHVHEVWTRRAIKCWYSKLWFIVPHNKISVWRTSAHAYRNSKHISTWLGHDILPAEHVDVWVCVHH